MDKPFIYDDGDDHRDKGRSDLAARIAKAGRRKRLSAFLFTMPLLAFIIVSFLAPIAMLLTRSVTEPEMARLLANTSQAVDGWDGAGMPPSEMVGAFLSDLTAAQEKRQAATIAKRVAMLQPALRKPILAAAKAGLEGTLSPEGLPLSDPLWRETASWQAIAQVARPLTDRYLLQTLDLSRDAAGNVVAVPAGEAIFLDALARTFGISIGVTLITLLLGYPLAYYINQQSEARQRFLLLFILLPFWTSILVRTAAWLVLLQTNGVVNDALMALNLLSEPLKLVYTRSGTILAMAHIQLPFTLLPIYSVMKTISPSYVRAARSLGATPTVAFWRIYVPQTLPGVAAGCLLTFILCLGYYITPAILGGPADQMLSYYVAYYLNSEVNWSMAAAVSTVLLVVTMLFYLAYSWLVDPARQAAR